MANPPTDALAEAVRITREYLNVGLTPNPAHVRLLCEAAEAVMPRPETYIVRLPQAVCDAADEARGVILRNSYSDDGDPLGGAYLDDEARNWAMAVFNWVLDSEDITPTPPHGAGDEGMSTRCSITFVDSLDELQRLPLGHGASIYQHCDGYPDGPNGIVALFDAFCEAVENHGKVSPLRSNHFGDAEFLAATFVGWVLTRNGKSPLSNGNNGLMAYDHADLAYRYAVVCERDTTRPTLLVRMDEAWVNAAQFGEATR